jgi:glutathione S-transferase
MAELILHHYDISPYSEKIRLIMGLKQLRWRSVQIPIVMPKPDLTALTGGYRLTPVLQIGADVYCDTQIIARRLEQERANPTLYPPGAAALTRAMSSFGESTFVSLVYIGFATGLFSDDFIRDRQTLVPGGVNVEMAKAVAPSKVDEIRAKLDLIEKQLGDGRKFLLGDEISLADVSTYHPLWGFGVMPDGIKLLEPLKSIRGWMERVAAIGHGDRSEMEGQEAVEIAARSQPTTQPHVDADDPNGRKVGDGIKVFPEAYGRDPVVGELIYADAHEIALLRTDERAGEVVVHFPREGYITLPA